MNNGSCSRIPVDRVLERLDADLAKRDYEAAERHLRYWCESAEACGDRQGKLTVCNEQIGLYRKIGKVSEGLAAIEEALALMQTLGLQDTVTAGTTLLNAATGYKAFGMAQQALPLYEQAQVIYENILPPDDARLGGLYNNMALTVASLGDCRKAEALYQKALSVMEQVEHGEAEMAITYCNLADLYCAEYGAEQGEAQINACLNRAEALLDADTIPHDGYFAFVCEKCAPTFGHYGFFFTEQKLLAQSRNIYERT